MQRIPKDKNGRAAVRTEGQCKSCGSITITSGKWRTAQHPNRFVRCLADEESEANWLFGNPLTFNHARARKFGRARFGHGEGFHGHSLTRFGLLKRKAWYRRREQAQRDFPVVFCGMHALAMDQRARLRKRAPGGLPVVAASVKPPAPVNGSTKAA